MTLLRSTFYLILPAFVLLLLSSAAMAQTAVNYRFLEVLDDTGKPVADAKVEAIRDGGPVQTDKNGTARFGVMSGDFNTTGLKVSKTGYFSYEDIALFRSPLGIVLDGELPETPREAPIRIVLLRTDADEPDRKAIETRQRGRELIQAIKNRDLASVEKLLKSGVSPDTTDDYKIAGIVWAAANGDLSTVKALLAAGADVRDKTRSGSRALLYYLSGRDHVYANGQDLLDYNFIETLLKAGIDVSAANRHDVSALSIARGSGNAKLKKLIEDADALREDRIKYK